MKRLYLLAAMLLMGAETLLAQDTIVLRSGDELKVKVKEVSDTELKYLLWDSYDGPLYIKKVKDIFMVKYESGHREVYGNAQQPAPATTQQNNNGFGGSAYNYGDGDYMESSRGDLLLNGHSLNDDQIKVVLGIDGYNTYSSAKAQRRVGKTLVTLGWMEFGLGAFSEIMVLTAYEFFSYPEAETLATMATLFFVASNIELPLGYVLKGIGTGRLNWLADDYNTNRSYSDNLSLGFSPTLVCAPDAAGNRSFGLGAGVTLHF